MNQWQPNGMFHAWMAQRRPWQQQQQPQLMSPNPMRPQLPPGISQTQGQANPMELLGIPQGGNKWGGV